MKKIDLSRSVFELTEEYPELIEIMVSLGFSEVSKKPVLHSIGKLMTIPKGCKMKNIPMEKAISALIENGFEIEGKISEAEVSARKLSSSSSETRTGLLKNYLLRLAEGEDLEAVRADFTEKFSDVEASEIMKAEQELMAGGMPLSEVQKLCDLHSALFHGATREEKIANAELAVEASIKKEQNSQPDYSNKKEKAGNLASLSGHPLNTFSMENEALSSLLDKSGYETADVNDLKTVLNQVREIAIHYAKKGDLLYPLLKVKYGISGPSDVMWTVDDEIRDEISALLKAEAPDPVRIKAVLKRAEEMIYKETNILFPICAVNFTDDEWKQIYIDSKDYAVCLGVETVWEDGEKYSAAKPEPNSDEVFMPGGHMTVNQLTALLNTIPLEITFVDDKNINRFFNEGPKVFKRPGMAIDREVFSCHPPKIEPMVRAIIDDFRSGKRDSVPIWMDKNGKTMLVTYMAVRDRNKNYVGTVEIIQNMEFAKEHFAK